MEFLTEILSIVALVTAVFTLVLSMNYKKRKDREVERETRAELSYMREKLEREIYELNKRLYSDTNRWKDINHLLINNENKNELKVSDSLITLDFFNSIGINTDNIDLKSNLVFLLTPFHNDFEIDYDNVKNICENLGLNCIRGDENFIRGNILKYIVEQIMSSRIVIANLNGRNPNVYYELGIAHAIGKPVILIAKSFDEIPFDLQSNRIIIYSNYSDLEKSLTSMLYQVFIKER